MGRLYTIAVLGAIFSIYELDAEIIVALATPLMTTFSMSLSDVGHLMLLRAIVQVLLRVFFYCYRHISVKCDMILTRLSCRQ